MPTFEILIRSRREEMVARRRVRNNAHRVEARSEPCSVNQAQIRKRHEVQWDRRQARQVTGVAAAVVAGRQAAGKGSRQGQQAGGGGTAGIWQATRRGGGGEQARGTEGRRYGRQVARRW